MGAADLIPGVSGGTIAFLFGIYEELLYSIKTITGTTLKLFFTGKFRQAFQSIPFSFLIPLFLGIGLAIFGLANLFSFLLDTYAVFMWSFFFGLVVGSALIVRKRIKRWSWKVWVSLIAGTVVTYIIVGSPTVDLGTGPLAFFGTGIIAFCAMILPGISGSLIMVILGQYEAVLQAVTDRNFGLLVFLAAGGAVGLALFARLLGWLLRRYHAVVIAFLIGMLIGSLRKVWPWREPVDGGSHTEAYVPEQLVFPPLDWNLFLCIVLAGVAILAVLQLEKIGITQEHDEDIPDKAFKKEYKEIEKAS